MKLFKGGYDPKRVVQIGKEGHISEEKGQEAHTHLNPETAAFDLPDRYAIKDQEKKRYLTCIEAPTLKIKVERGYSVTAAGARKFPAGSIFLDGAAQGEPFLDVEKQIFNLDHHEGCVRSFTLAACEQAMVVVRKRINLRNRDWTIYASEPDLDTIVAIWVLCNHIRLNDDDPEIRQKIMPLVRLQGVIDAHGLEMQELAGLPGPLHRETFAQLEKLRETERSLQKNGRWLEIDFLEYTANLLRAIDAMVYFPHHFEGEAQIEELGRSEIGGRWLAIACASETGIYLVEQQLRRLHGDRLGIIILQKDPKTYTLRRADQSLPVSLDRIYDQLNLMDPAAGSGGSSNRWGGSDEIGGSPRTSGTKLDAQQIADICSQSYRKPSRTQQLAAIAESFAVSALFILSALIVILAEAILSYRFLSFTDVFTQGSGLFSGVLGVLSLGFLAVVARKSPRVYGLSKPAGFDWWFLLPAAILCGLAGGSRFPAALHPDPTPLFQLSWDAILLTLAFAATAELLFRSAVHGILFQRFRGQKAGGKWFLSWPVLISGLAYSFWACIPLGILEWPATLYIVAGTLLLGISCGMARERSGSIFPPILLHWAALLSPVVLL